MTRELQLRDKEILDTMRILASGSTTLAALGVEVTKRCGCIVPRIDEAIKRADQNPEHLYWKT